MAIRLSTGLRNHLMRDGSFKNAFGGGVLKIYSGSQPATADTAISGTHLVTITLASGARTDEVRATGTVTLTGGASGSVDQISVNSVNLLSAAVPYNTSLTQTATDVATAINSYTTSPDYVASASGAVITIKAMPGTGTGPNGYVVASTTTTITKSDVNMASGVAQVNGLTWGDVSAGVLSKASGVWSGVAANSGTAGWFRLQSTEVDAGGSSTTLIRLDGNIAVSGANLNMSNTSITAAATITIDSFSITEPSA